MTAGDTRGASIEATSRESISSPEKGSLARPRVHFQYSSLLVASVSFIAFGG
jgi:hypothetical protein